MNNNFGIHELNELLKEKLNIEEIIFPTVNQRIINHVGLEYTFENGEKFEGRMENNRMISGIYTWPDRQQYKGDFSENNNLRKGEIIFLPSDNKLTGIYNQNKETFEKCIYETDSYVYEGNIKRNKFHGNSSIQNKENESSYSLKGKYDEGKRKGNFEIINEKDGIKYKINGKYRYGKKNGNFKVYNLETNELIFDYDLSNDVIQLSENNNFKIKNIKKNIDINCIEILNKGNRLILLLGAENKIFLYDIKEEKDLSEIKFLNRCNILDILALSDKNILVCKDKNKFNLLDIKVNRNSIEAEIIAEFSGKDNSSNIFSLREIHKDLIVSGDCNNLIFWKKDFSNRNNNIIQKNNNNNKEDNNKNNNDNNNKDNNNDNNKDNNNDNNKNNDSNNNDNNNNDNNNDNNNNNNNNNIINNNIIEINNNVNNDDCNICDSIKNMFYNCLEYLNSHIFDEINNEIIYYSFNEINHIPLTRTYCFIEIKEKERDVNNIILAVAQPDNESVIIYDICYINNNININAQREIEGINTLINRKNIMTYKDNILYVGCKDSIKLIRFNNINDVQIVNNIVEGKVSFINPYRNEYLLCGINKNKSEYNFEGKLKQYEINEEEENEIVPVYENNMHRHNGSIINSIICYDTNEEYIVSLGTDKNVLVSHEKYELKEEQKNEIIPLETLGRSERIGELEPNLLIEDNI